MDQAGQEVAMIRARELLIGVFLVASLLFLLGLTTDGDKGVLVHPYEPIGEKHFFVTVTGTGDCSSWNHACTFRTAVGKTSNTFQDIIHLGEGAHDTNNGSDGTGTTITAVGVSIIGQGTPWACNAALINSHASASMVLKVTGNGFNIEKIHFLNTGQADENVIFLNINGSVDGSIKDCRFDQADTATSGTGILFDNSSANYHMETLTFYNVEDYAIQTNGMTGIHAEHIHIDRGGVGIDFNGASDGEMCFDRIYIHRATTGISVTGASVDNVFFDKVIFTHNTTNISENGTYDGIHWQNVEAAHKKILVYPANAGTVITTGDGAWTWTASPTTIIPSSTISNPFYITAINVQAFDSTQTYKIELLYGESTADTSLGIHEFTVGLNTPASVLWIQHTQLVKVAIPKDSVVGAKLMSSTDGTDNITVTLSYLDI
jgi:hypothetical protein